MGRQIQDATAPPHLVRTGFLSLEFSAYHRTLTICSGLVCGNRTSKRLCSIAISTRRHHENSAFGFLRDCSKARIPEKHLTVIMARRSACVCMPRYLTQALSRRHPKRPVLCALCLESSSAVLESKARLRGASVYVSRVGTAHDQRNPFYAALCVARN